MDPVDEEEENTIVVEVTSAMTRGEVVELCQENISCPEIEKQSWPDLETKNESTKK